MNTYFSLFDQYLLDSLSYYVSSHSLNLAILPLLSLERRTRIERVNNTESQVSNHSLKNDIDVDHAIQLTVIMHNNPLYFRLKRDTTSIRPLYYIALGVGNHTVSRDIEREVKDFNRILCSKFSKFEEGIPHVIKRGIPQELTYMVAPNYFNLYKDAIDSEVNLTRRYTDDELVEMVLNEMYTIYYNDCNTPEERFDRALDEQDELITMKELLEGANYKNILINRKCPYLLKELYIELLS